MVNDMNAGRWTKDDFDAALALRPDASRFEPLGEPVEFKHAPVALKAAEDWMRAVSEGVGHTVRFRRSKEWLADGFWLRTFVSSKYGDVLLVKEWTYGATACANVKRFVLASWAHGSRSEENEG